MRTFDGIGFTQQRNQLSCEVPELVCAHAFGQAGESGPSGLECLVEHRYRAVLEVLDGCPVSEVAIRYGVARQSVYLWRDGRVEGPLAPSACLAISSGGRDGGGTGIGLRSGRSTIV